MTQARYSSMNPEITDSYRRTLVFNNSLLIQQFDQRYEFQTQEHVRKMTTSSRLSRPWSDKEVQEYLASRAKNKEKRRQKYARRLESNVEPAVQRYSHNIMAFIHGSGEDSYM